VGGLSYRVGDETAAVAAAAATAVLWNVVLWACARLVN